MIFMDSIPSFQGNLSANGTFMSTVHEDDEVGEDTHLIINNTLASLRREVAQTSDPVEDATETIAIPDIPDTEEPAEEVFVPIIREHHRLNIRP
jgi:serine/arginine repetitive matrix protein 2